MRILAIESSCDETAVTILKATENNFEILANLVWSQIKTHKKYGGVVPEVAARMHLEKIIPLLNEAQDLAKTKLNKIDYIAVTTGPGLISSLLVGTETAKALSFAYNKPIVSINHLEGHIYANFFKHRKDIKFPALCLIISGGHTELILIKKHGDYQLVGQTRDDACGEAFDKTAKILGLPYPGGPKLSELAKKGNSQAIAFPRPMLNSEELDMSFSGLKTAVLYETKKYPDMDKKIKQNIAASFQQAVCDVLLAKTKKAAKKYNVKTVMLSGGVSANSKIREEFLNEFSKEKMPLFFPDIDLCTDNSLMIAIAAYFNLKNIKSGDYSQIIADPNWELV